MPDAEQTQPSSRRIGRWLVNAALVGLSTCFALLLAEVAIGALRPQQALPEWYRDDPVYGRSLKPNFHQRLIYLGHRSIDVMTNSLGLRDDEPPPPDAPRPRILFLGDSFVFGYGINVNERIDNWLKAKFLANRRQVTTINAGVPTWGTIQELKFAREHLDRFDPDAIVLVYCGNDQQNDRDYLAGKTDFREHGLFYLPGKDWLRARSHLYRLALYTTTAWRQRIASRAQAGKGVQIDSQTASVLTDADWERTRTEIQTFMDDVRRDRPHVRLYLLASEPLDGAIRTELERIAEHDGIEFVDFSESFLRLKDHERRLPYDPHWSPLVHELAGRALYDAMASDLSTN